MYWCYCFSIVFILIFHLLAATIWVGGHLFLAIRILPEALKKKDASILKNFKSKFEPVGMPSLLVLLITGILMAYHYNVTFTKWFSFSNAIEKVISIKLILLFRLHHKLNQLRSDPLKEHTYE